MLRTKVDRWWRSEDLLYRDAQKSEACAEALPRMARRQLSALHWVAATQWPASRRQRESLSSIVGVFRNNQRENREKQNRMRMAK